MKKGVQSKKGTLALLAVNLVCVALLAGLFVNYSARYRARFYRQNISSIESLNRSTATVAGALFTFQSQRVSDMARTIESERMTLDRALEFLGTMDDGRLGSFELVGQDDTGFAPGASGGAPAAVDYTDSTYSELQAIFRGAGPQGKTAGAYTPEFTDAATAFKCFAFYAYVQLRADGGDSWYTLLLVSRSDELLEKIQQKGDYRGLAVALMDDKGSYIIGSPDFKSDNFFKYLYVFNGLTLDERNALAAQVLGTASGTLRYGNSTGADCVFVYEKPRNEAWYSLTCVPVDAFDYPGYGSQLTALAVALLSVMLVVDVLWLNRMNRRLKLSVAREQKANAAKTEFLSRMSHDIRTPLNAILGFAAITRESPLLVPELAGNLAKINLSGRYLLGVLNDVLDMAKIESGKVELHETDTDCRRLFQEVAEIFSGEAERKGIRLETAFDFGAQRWLLLDPLRVKQIFSNLLSNAVKFSGSGTVIRWTARAAPTEDGRVELVSAVRDQGCGMSPEFQKTLFEPFTQERSASSNEIPGTGLGLAIVYRLAKLMGGAIRVDSAPGEGTTFTLTAVLRPGADAGADALPAASGTPDALRGKRVLLCEDNALNREIAGVLLSSRGVLYEAAEDGRLGVERFAASAVGWFDAVLMDIRMPRMDGLAATAAIRAMDRSDAKTVPIIAMTANAYDEDIRVSLQAGMTAHLAKPFEPEVLYATLEKYCAAGAAAPANPPTGVSSPADPPAGGPA
jgi:signal transduction histidine kinase